MALMTPHPNPRPCRKPNCCETYSLKAMNRSEVDLSPSAAARTIWTKWLVTKDQLQLAQTRWKIMQLLFHPFMISKFAATSFMNTAWEEFLIPLVIILLPDIGLFRMGIRYGAKVWTMIQHFHREIHITSRTRRRPKERIRETQILWFQFAKNSRPLPSRLMVLSAVQLRQSYIGMMRKMGQPYPSDPFGLEKASTSAERSYFDLKNRTERKIITKFSSMCDYIAMTGMVINAIMLKAFERHRIRVRSLIEYRRGIYIMMTRAMAFTHSTNSTTDDQQNANFSASKEPMEFGLDNCATHHICTNKALFSEIKIPEREIGVQGVAGSLAAEGIGTIAFNITDDNGKLHAIVLQNVILLPSAPKNLISVSRWSKDACDDCTITSGGEYSVFRWGNERFKKTVHHPPECSIPLMQVNEDKGDKALLMFTREHRLQFIAEDANEAQRQPNDNVLQGNIVGDKQSPATNPCDASSELRAGDTVHISRNGKRILATVKRSFELETVPLDTESLL